MEETHVANNKVCPVCFQRTARRISRKWWMRLRRHSRYYSCSACSSRFITIAEDRVIVLRNGLVRRSQRRAAGVKREDVQVEQGAELEAPVQATSVVHEEGATEGAGVVSEFQSGIVPWRWKRFWVLTVVGILALLGLVYGTVRLTLTQEFKRAGARAAQAERQPETMSREVAFYKELIGELEAEVRRAETSLREMEARIAAVSSGLPIGPATAGAARMNVDELPGTESGNRAASLLELEARRQLMQENAAYKVLVFTSRGGGDLLAQKVVERLQADSFRVASLIVPAGERPSASIDMECTPEAAEKAKQLRDFVARLATALGQGAREVQLRSGIRKGVTAAPPEKREIRIFF